MQITATSSTTTHEKKTCRIILGNGDWDIKRVRTSTASGVCRPPPPLIVSRPPQPAPAGRGCLPRRSLQDQQSILIQVPAEIIYFQSNEPVPEESSHGFSLHNIHGIISAGQPNYFGLAGFVPPGDFHCLAGRMGFSGTHNERIEKGLFFLRLHPSPGRSPRPPADPGASCRASPVGETRTPKQAFLSLAPITLKLCLRSASPTCPYLVVPEGGFF